MNLKSIKTGLQATIQIGVCTVAIALPLLVACGGKISPGDTSTTGAGAIPVEVTGTQNFLVYPNPLNSPAIDSLDYAQTYYTAIDPNNDRDTLDKWKAVNHFGDPATGVEQQAVFGDVRDLGYGRYVTARWNNDGTWAFMVDNYLVAPTANYAYTALNVEAAVAQDKQWSVGINAIEISPGPECPAGTQLTQDLFVKSPITNPKCKYFAKFFNFDPVTGERQKAVNLDGLGTKAMPGICLVCHGGRGDEILPSSVAAASSVLITPGTHIPALFPYFGHPISEVRGDVKGRLHIFEVDTFDFSTKPGYTRADQEAALKTLNQWVLDTYPMPYGQLYGASAVDPTDRDRPAATIWEWQGLAADVLKAAYGGASMPSATYSDTYVPASWVSVGQTTLYNDVVKPACRVCHLLRGVALMPDISFDTFAGFQSFADKIYDHVIDRGNMPLSRILYDRYWSTPSMYQTLNQFLSSSNMVNGSAVQYAVTDSTGAQLKPGRPIADFGPNRKIGGASLPVTTPLSAQWSLFSDNYTWSITSNPGGAASLSSTTGESTTFTATAEGTYIVQLISGKGSVHSEPVQQKIVVGIPGGTVGWRNYIQGVTSAVSAASAVALGNSWTKNPYPPDIRFYDIKAVLQTHCTGCHKDTSSTNSNRIPPINYDNMDRNGDEVPESGVGQTDDILFYNQILSFVNFKDISNSQLLRHPAGYAHGGHIQCSFGSPYSSTSCRPTVSGDKLEPGDINRDGYDMFINWILNGAPYSCTTNSCLSGTLNQ